MEVAAVAILQQNEAEFVRRTSVLDSLRDEARRFAASLGTEDNRKLDEYLRGIRARERRMQDEKDWRRRPKPNVASLEFGKEQGLDPDAGGLVSGANGRFRRHRRLARPGKPV